MSLAGGVDYEDVAGGYFEELEDHCVEDAVADDVAVVDAVDVVVAFDVAAFVVAGVALLPCAALPSGASASQVASYPFAEDACQGRLLAGSRNRGSCYLKIRIS